MHQAAAKFYYQITFFFSNNGAVLIRDLTVKSNYCFNSIIYHHHYGRKHVKKFHRDNNKV